MHTWMLQMFLNFIVNSCIYLFCQILCLPYISVVIRNELEVYKTNYFIFTNFTFQSLPATIVVTLSSLPSVWFWFWSCASTANLYYVSIFIMFLENLIINNNYKNSFFVFYPIWICNETYLRNKIRGGLKVYPPFSSQRDHRLIDNRWRQYIEPRRDITILI